MSVICVLIFVWLLFLDFCDHNKDLFQIGKCFFKAVETEYCFKQQLTTFDTTQKVAWSFTLTELFELSYDVPSLPLCCLSDSRFNEREPEQFIMLDHLFTRLFNSA